MTVYVDKIQQYPRKAIQSSARRHGNFWCHMFSDDEDKSELHEIARRIGHKKDWFQEALAPVVEPENVLRKLPRHILAHYDLVPTRRELALRAGAVEGSFREIIRKVIQDDE